MKRRGSAMVVVLCSLLALSIVSIAVFAYVNNTSRLNKEEFEKNQIILASKSALNITIYDLLDKVQKGAVIDNDTLKNDLDSIIEKTNDESLKKYMYDVKIVEDNSSRYKISILASNKDRKYEISKNVNLKLVNSNNSIRAVEKFMKMNSSITILNNNDLDITNLSFGMSNASFNIDGVINNPKISGTSQFKAFIKNKFPYFIDGMIGNKIENIQNYNYGFDRSKGLKLKFGKSNCNIRRYTNLIAAINKSDYNAFLLDSYGVYKSLENYSDVTLEDLKSSSGIIIKNVLGNYIILVNGNLYLNGYISNIENTFVYATKGINIDSYVEFSKWNLDIKGSSLIANENIWINSNRWLDITAGQYNVDSKLKDVLMEFVK